METPANQLPALLSRKKVLKTKITKARNTFSSMIEAESHRDDIGDDFKEFNVHHREIRNVFNRIYELVGNDDNAVGKYVDEEHEIKQIYRDTKRLVESYLTGAQIDVTVSSAFSQSVQGHITPVPTNDTSPNTKEANKSIDSPEFRGFEESIAAQSSNRVEGRNGTRSSDFHSVQCSVQARSSTPIDDDSRDIFDVFQQRFTKFNIDQKDIDAERQREYFQQLRVADTQREDDARKRQFEKSRLDQIQMSLDAERQKTVQERQFLERERQHYDDMKRQFEIQQARMTHTPTSYTPLKLEPLTLQSFDGSYDKWEPFRDMYEAIVHESHMTTIEKFQRLRKLLTGSAAVFVQNIPMSEASYHEVWKDMKDNYDNPRRIVASHIQGILSLKPLTESRAGDLRHTLDVFKSNLRALKTSGQQSNAEIFQLHILLSKLDPDTQQKFEAKLSTVKEIPRLQDLYDMLEKRIRALEVTVEPVPLSKKSSKQEFRKKSSLHASGKNVKCHICQKDHLIYKCPDLNGAKPVERLEMINNKGLCHNCFSMNHKVVDCKSGHCRVKECNQKHHTLLHDVLFKKVTNLISTLFSRFNEAVLATALVIVKVNGQPHTARALLDGGSQCNFITNAFCQRLKLETYSQLVDITGIGKSSHEINRSVQLTLSSHFCDYSINISCLVMEDITEKLPQEQFDVQSWKISSSTKLADPKFNKPDNIDILLSASVFFDALTEGIVEIGKSKPRLFTSQFGWLVAGGGLHAKARLAPRPHAYHVISKQSLAQQIEKFWTVESIPEEEKVRSIEDEIVESHFIQTCRRVNDRFEVNLPFKLDSSHLQGDNRSRAEACWLATERRISKDDHLRTLYNEFMSVYISRGHMREASPTDDIKYFIPHHHVWKEGISEKKFRVVFNASSKANNKTSLNDLLYVGPAIQDDLFSIMLRFREHRIALAGDIEKMYRQILVNESDQLYQGIIWREHQDQPLKVFKLCTLTYGTAPASFIATRCIRQAAALDGHQFPLAASIVTRDFYMDDLLTSCNDEERAIEIRNQVQGLLDNSGLPMRKWISNSDAVLKSIPSKFRGIEDTLNMQMDETIKTLGMHWSPSTDQFRFSTTKFHDTHTKRNVISDIAKLFDPNGLLGPIVMKAKCIMQILWKRHLSWDEKLPEDLDKMWEDFKGSMISLDYIRIDRGLICSRESVRIWLIGFSDASEFGYGACLYIVSETPDGNLDSKLVCSKSRVAPIKTQSIPRLELCGAVILAELLNSVKHTLTSRIDNICCFTDSKIVLSWLAKEPATWNVFIANRISKIQQIIPSEAWFHVRSEDNPADVLSRGASPEDLPNSHMWWKGPLHFIKEHIHQQGESQSVIPDETELDIIQQERKRLVYSVVERIPTFIDKLLTTKSKLSFIIRIVAYVKRFVHNLKSKESDNKLIGPLTYAEIVNAQTTLTRHSQCKYFSEEVHAMESGLPFPRHSKLLCLRPVWDKETKLIKVGGRVSKAKLPEPRKHQMILPSDDIFTRRLFEMMHLRLLHAGPQLMLHEVRHQWWPLNGKRIAQTVLHKCVTCFKRTPKLQTQIMGDLPRCRLTKAKSFMSTGIDFAGPFKSKQNEGPRCKNTRDAYICIFVCCSTKAVHLEVVSSYTTNAFLACLRRFVSRRGKIRHIYCDNGTNFVGANNMLRKLLKDEEATETLNHEFDHIDFHFAPARSPHTGGLYEANIRSMKKHLNRVMGKMILNFEELQTLVVQIEACLNSRPLCTLPTGPEEIGVLTPGHFLTGEPLTAVPDVDYTDINPNRLTRWCQIQQMLQKYWQVWSTEYINSLQKRYKWKEESDNLKINDIVLVKEENMMPLHWKLGRVVRVFPDEYQKVRTVELIINNHLTRRTVHKLCKLPIDDRPETSEDEEEPEITL